MQINILVGVILIVILKNGLCSDKSEVQADTKVIYSSTCKTLEAYQKKYGANKDSWDYSYYCKPQLRMLREVVSHLPLIPEEYLKNNIKNKDFRFRGVYSYTCHVSDQDALISDKKYIDKYGVICFEGLSDSRDGIESTILIYGLAEYSRQYNNLLLNYLKSKKVFK
jgi:hypothetical protein